MEIPFADNGIDGIGFTGREIIAHLEPGGIPEEIHMSHLHRLGFETQSFLQVLK